MTERLPGGLGEWSSATRRWVLWGALVTLVASLLVTLVWLAGRYEAGVLQDRIERDAVDVTADIRSGLLRNTQGLQGLPAFDPGEPDKWFLRASAMLRAHREMLRIESRDESLNIRSFADSELRARVFDPDVRTHLRQ